MNNLVTINNFTFKYNNESLIFKDADFYVKDCEILGIYGENGCGKTTLFKIIQGDLKLEKGSVVFDNKQHISILSQNDRELASGSPLTVYEFLYMYLKTVNKVNKKEANQIIDQYLNSYNLMHLKKRQLRKLSGGQIQIVMILKSIICPSNLLLMDEPLVALDETIQDKIITMIKNLKNEKMTVIIILHDHELLKSLCDRILEVKNHQLVEVKL